MEKHRFYDAFIPNGEGIFATGISYEDQDLDEYCEHGYFDGNPVTVFYRLPAKMVNAYDLTNLIWENFFYNAINKDGKQIYLSDIVLI